MSASPLSRIGLASTSGDDAGASSGNRKAVLGIGVLTTAGLAVAATFLLGGGDDLDDLGSVPAAAAATPPAAAPAVPSPSSPPRFPDADDVQDGRNPFAALHVEPAPGAVAPAAGTPGAGVVPPAGVAPPPTTGGAAAAPVAAPAAAPVAAPAAGPPAGGATGTLLLALLRTEGADPSRTAVFTVGGAEQSVAVGEGFGPDGSLLLLSLQQGPDEGGWTAVVQRGQGDPFDVVTGTPVSLG